MRRPAAFLLSFAFSAVLAAAPAASAAEEPLQVRAGAAYGYDDNVRLDPQRKGDDLFQENASVRFKRRLNEILRIRLEYDVFNVNYSEVTDLNVLYQDGGVGFDWLLSKNTALQFDYDLESVYFPWNEPVTSYANEGRVGLVQRVGKARVRAGVAGSRRQFTDNKLREHGGILSSDDERTDGRWGPDVEVSFQPLPWLAARAGYAHFENDSDDAFHDFYDYGSDAFWASGTFKAFERTYAYVKFSYEDLEYDSRPLVGRVDSFEDSQIYTLTLSLMRQLGPRLSLIGNYSYRQKESNEPSREYSGSVTTLGLQYSF